MASGSPGKECITKMKIVFMHRNWTLVCLFVLIIKSLINSSSSDLPTTPHWRTGWGKTAFDFQRERDWCLGSGRTHSWSSSLPFRFPVLCACAQHHCLKVFLHEAVQGMTS